jgi:hypothetical protein
MTENEIEEHIYETLDVHIGNFLDDLPTGMMQDAMSRHITGPARLAGRVDAKLQELFPRVPAEIPVLEGVVVPEVNGKET